MEEILQALLAVDSVICAVLASRDGLIIASAAEDAAHMSRAAIASALIETAEKYCRDMRLGAVQQTVITAGSGVIVLTEAGRMLLITESSRLNSAGLIMAEARRAARALQRQQ